MIDFKPIDKRRADDMFTSLPQEAKWSEVTGALLGGQAVFVPYMSRSQLEVLRGIVNYRAYGRLRSRTVTVDDKPGKLLRMARFGEGVGKGSRRP